MNLLAAATIVVASALDWAVYSPLDVPLDIEGRDKESVARIYAARGEYEGLHLAVSGRRNGVSALQIEAEAPGKDIPPPMVYQLLPVTGAEITGECLDVLAPAGPLQLAPGETAHFWVRYAIPTGAKAGVRKSQIRLSANDERTIEVPLRLEIFDFDLPERPSLPNVFYLDRVAARRVFKLKDPALAPWRPLYEAMGGYRLGFSLWDGTGLGAGQETTDLQQHLAFAAENLGVAALDLAGGNGAGWKSIPTPGAGQSLDPLNLFLNKIAASPGLAGVPLTAAFDSFPSRAAWPGIADQLGRLSNGAQVLRVAAAPLHPDFEAVLDAWALPFRQSNPALLGRLKQGGGLRGALQFPPARFTASGADMNTLGVPYPSAPLDAADGSPYTAWIPARGLSGAEDHFWQADFDAPAPADEVVLTWLNGRSTEAVTLFTSLDGRTYAKAAVQWEHRPAPNALEWPTSRAKLRFPGDIFGVRIVVHVSKDEPLPALAEVALANLPVEAAEVAAHPIKPWLALELDTFPSAYPGRNAVEPRILGWVCWFGGFEGLLGTSLNAWPAGIAPHDAGAPYDLPQDGGDYLYYAIDGTLQPSLRLERLRDGLEDYEYLRLLQDARDHGEKLPAEARELLTPMPLSPTPKPEALADWARHILETRIKIGRALGK